MLTCEDMQNFENILRLQQYLPHLSINGNDIYNFFPIFLGGSLDDIVAVDDLRVIVLVDALIDCFEVIVEHFLVAIFVEIVEELIEF